MEKNIKKNIQKKIQKKIQRNIKKNIRMFLGILFWIFLDGCSYDQLNDISIISQNNQLAYIFKFYIGICVYRSHLKISFQYTEWFLHGKQNPRPYVKIVKSGRSNQLENSAVSIMDADGGLGIHVGPMAMKLAIKKESFHNRRFLIGQRVNKYFPDWPKKSLLEKNLQFLFDPHETWSK